MGGGPSEFGRDITVKVMRHTKTGLRIAVSDQDAGLYAHGRSYAELRQNTLDALRTLYEARGYERTSFEVLSDDTPADFESGEMKIRTVESMAA
jgi:hypothetical protein